MKKRDVKHWNHREGHEGLLLLAQTLADVVFDYSYESYRIPALNSHYLCYDVMSAAYGIETKTIMNGSFVPLAEEFENMIKQ